MCAWRCLSQSPSTFLDGDERYFAAFDEVGQLSRMQSALQSDHRMAQWMPKLVPRKSQHTRTHTTQRARLPTSTSRSHLNLRMSGTARSLDG